jgi:SAM-dependent methyltransferase
MDIVRNMFSVGRKFGLPKEQWGWRYFLDVWCGDWPSLGTMQKRWWKAYGFDIGELVRKWNIFYGPNISDTDFWWLQFDVIYLAHSLEHMEDPEWSLKKIYNLLKKWGKVIITTPNIDCMSSKYLGPYVLERDIPRHVIVHTLKSATLLLKKWWFSIVEYKYLPQWLIYDWYVWRNKDLGKKSYSIMKVVFILYRIYATLIWKTNQIWFILTK